MVLDKILAKELDQLRKKLTDLNDSITNTTNEYLKKDREYTSAKRENQKLLRRAFDIGNEQDLKLSDLDEKIEHFEMKLGVLEEEMAELATTFKENAFEVGKLKAEIKETKKIDEKRIADMTEEVQEAKADLREERDLELSLIKERKQLLLNARKEYQKKLREAEQLYEERYKKAETRYKAAERPLLCKIKCMDSEIRDIEKEISFKPEEMKSLRLKHESLLKKLQKMRNLK